MYFLLFVSNFACQSEYVTTEKSEDHTSNFQLSIIDSLEIAYQGELKYSDFLSSENVHLLADLASTTVLEVDKDGTILNQFICGGKEEGKIGNYIAAIGYVNDSTIGIVSGRGIFFFDRGGKLLESIKSPITFPSLVYQYFFTYRDTLNNYLVYDCDPFFDYTKQLFRPGEEAYYRKFRSLTLYDLNTNNKSMIGGFEEESLFLQNPDIPYVDIRNNFYLEDKYLYALFNPDPNIYVYDISNNMNYEFKISLSPDKYKRLADDKKEINVNRKLIVNSTFNGIFKDNDQIVVIYTSGVPEDMYPKSGLSVEEINETLIQYDFLYMSIYNEKGDKISKDIKAPFQIASINKKIAPHTFIATPNAGRVEKVDKELFYMVELKKNN